MRITGGILRGRLLKTPGGGVRPTQDRVREALFSMLGERIVGARFLDLFAGSGAVGLEAWSRGAGRVVWVERDRKVLSVLRANARELLGAEEGIVGGDVTKVLSRPRFWDEPFDIVFADPPYARNRPGRRAPGGDRFSTRPRSLRRVAEEDLPGRLLECLGSRGAAGPATVVVMEQGAEEAGARHSAWIMTKDRVYGSTRLRMYSMEGGGNG